MNIALITGAAGIVGPGICAELKAAGWTVAAADRSVDAFSRQASAAGRPLDADLRLEADLTDPAAIAGLIAEVRRRAGPIALLVNNATAHSHAVPLAELDAATFEQIWRVDAVAPLLLAQAAADDLAASQGLVVNLSSVRLQHITPGHLPYIAAKAAIEKMTEAMALEFSPRGIRVNCLRLGQVPGDGFLQPALALLPPELGARLRAAVLPAHYAAAAARSSLGGHYGTPADIGRAIAFLASPAGQFINGAVLPIDGGFVLRQHERAAQAAGALSLAEQWQADPRGQVRAWLKSQDIAHEF